MSFVMLSARVFRTRVELYSRKAPCFPALDEPLTLGKLSGRQLRQRFPTRIAGKFHKRFDACRSGPKTRGGYLIGLVAMQGTD